MADQVRRFEAWDYAVFGAMLFISAAIGVYYAVVGRKQKSTKEFLLASSGMGVLPVAISILLSFMSAILVLGSPAEMYTEGTQFYMRVIGSLGCAIASVIFVPLFYSLHTASAFQQNMTLI
ncbi:sodium-coupled monocarboxylate transporter 1-like [Haliotis cracherodii]|uniref:sodium-coupled monocarboxylate transporter 1-like n=1 Tax=Haliotis cracherodii TaxID=6455 RepID=UPI0039EB428C